MAKTKKVKLKVSGMSCTGCSSSINRALSRIDGIENAVADHQKGTTIVKFDENKINLEKISSVIEDLGYKVES